jgi:hypothetical protein
MMKDLRASMRASGRMDMCITFSSGNVVRMGHVEPHVHSVCFKCDAVLHWDVSVEREGGKYSFRPNTNINFFSIAVT